MQPDRNSCLFFWCFFLSDLCVCANCLPSASASHSVVTRIVEESNNRDMGGWRDEEVSDLFDIYREVFV